jgi:hypothetical protein
MPIEFVRSLRTSSSERFLLRESAADVGALDIHYLRNGTVQATLIVIEGAGIAESQIPDLLTHIDEVLLPEVSLDDQQLVFTVVTGKVLGSFESSRDINHTTRTSNGRGEQ